MISVKVGSKARTVEFIGQFVVNIYLMRPLLFLVFDYCYIICCWAKNIKIIIVYLPQRGLIYQNSDKKIRLIQNGHYKIKRTVNRSLPFQHHLVLPVRRSRALESLQQKMKGCCYAFQTWAHFQKNTSSSPIAPKANCAAWLSATTDWSSAIAFLLSSASLPLLMRSSKRST